MQPGQTTNATHCRYGGAKQNPARRRKGERKKKIYGAAHCVEVKGVLGENTRLETSGSRVLETKYGAGDMRENGQGKKKMEGAKTMTHT